MAIKMSGKSTESKFEYVVEKKCGVISSYTKKDGTEVTAELRLVSWNGNESKYEIRQWAHTEDGEKALSEKHTFTGEELINLKELIILEEES